MSTILVDPEVHYEVSARDLSSWNVVKWVENDPKLYIVYDRGRRLGCSCPSSRSCRHLTMVKIFREHRKRNNNTMCLIFDKTVCHLYTLTRDQEPYKSEIKWWRKLLNSCQATGSQ